MHQLTRDLQRNSSSSDSTKWWSFHSRERPEAQREIRLRVPLSGLNSTLTLSQCLRKGLSVLTAGVAANVIQWCHSVGCGSVNLWCAEDLLLREGRMFDLKMGSSPRSTGSVGLAVFADCVDYFGETCPIRIETSRVIACFLAIRVRIVSCFSRWLKDEQCRPRWDKSILAQTKNLDPITDLKNPVSP